MMIGNQVKNQLNDQTKDHVKDQARNQARDQIRDQVRDQVKDQVQNQLNKCRKQNRPIQKRITLGQTAVARDGMQDIGLNKPGQHMRACEASD